jgi:hypothetical protein
MRADKGQPHFAPTSVGVLVDPAFLRSAMIDANGDRHAETVSRPTLHLRWKDTMHAIAAALRRH